MLVGRAGGVRDGVAEGRRIWSAILIVLLTAVLSSAATYGFIAYGRTDLYRMYRGAAVLRGTENFNRFLQVLDLVRTTYVEEVDTEKLMEGAISGVVRALDDPYSSFMTSAQYEHVLTEIQGTYYGVGMVVEQKEDAVLVVSPFKGTPAHRAGLRPGDRILKVDDLEVTGMSVNEVVRLIKGPEGTKVTITVQRDGYREPLHFTLTRALIVIPTVEWSMLDGKVGYLQIMQFTGKTAEDVAKALANLRSRHMEALILDLRLNGGGLLDQAVQVSDMFVPEGPIVHVVDREGRRKTYSARSGGFDLPLVVLVDKGTASAAEIVAGAVQDRGVGILVGTSTFGKASVQNVHNLGDGSGLRLTTARYLTPSGRVIDKTGLQPDMVVEAPKEEPHPNRYVGSVADPGTDVQLQKALEAVRERLAR